jgi:hypothetical protein
MPGLLRGLARTAMVAGTATAVSNRVSRRQAGRWAAQEYPQQQYPPQEYQQQYPPQEYQQQQAPPPQAPPAPAGGGYDQVLAQLKDLGDLKAQGVLSEAEFETQKRRILGG